MIRISFERPAAVNLKLRRRADASVCLRSSSSRQKKRTGRYSSVSGKEYSMTNYYVNKKRPFWPQASRQSPF